MTPEMVEWAGLIHYCGLLETADYVVANCLEHISKRQELEQCPYKCVFIIHLIFLRFLLSKLPCQVHHFVPYYKAHHWPPQGRCDLQRHIF